MGKNGSGLPPAGVPRQAPGVESDPTSPDSRGLMDARVGVLPGRTIGRYRLVSPVGAGGMAQVWAARPETAGLARTVAIKLVLPDYSSDEEYERMFVDEAMVASAIRHPNVCETYELGRDGELLFMVLEWIAGDSLSGLLQQKGQLKPLSDAVAARIVAEGCAGLHAAHEAVGPDGQPLGIVHRDVSPPNIMISTQGHVKVSDFGIAKARYQLHARTRTGEIKGKFAYIPPEQILGRAVDRRADVYAMGCVLYIATLGLRPFGGGASALGKIVQGKFLKPSELRKDYPPALEAIVLRALASKPDERFPTAEDMRMALEEWLMEAGEVVTESDVAKIVKERMSPERKTVIDAVTTSARAIPEALAYQLLARRDRMDTPTADSRIFMQRPSIRAPLSSQGKPPPLPRDPDATPTWRPPKKPDESDTLPPLAELQDSFAHDEHESTVRDRHPRALIPSDAPGRVAKSK
jgi:eukaryotic-like serine/threonine-protein kinase